MPQSRRLPKKAEKKTQKKTEKKNERKNEKEKDIEKVLITGAPRRIRPGDLFHIEICFVCPKKVSGVTGVHLFVEMETEPAKNSYVIVLGVKEEGKRQSTTWSGGVTTMSSNVRVPSNWPAGKLHLGVMVTRERKVREIWGDVKTVRVNLGAPLLHPMEDPPDPVPVAFAP